MVVLCDPALNGVEVVPVPLWELKLSVPARCRLRRVRTGSFGDRRDWNKFHDAYADPRPGRALPDQFMAHYSPVVRSPIGQARQEAIQRDIANLKAGLAAGIKGGWMNSVAPASCARFPNEYYKTDEERCMPATQCARSTRRSSTQG